MSTEQHFIVTAQAEFLPAAFKELQQLDERLMSIEELSPEMMLCRIPDTLAFMRKAARAHPVFARHLAPVQESIPIANDEQDIGTIALHIARMPAFEQIAHGTYFAVQSRFAQTDRSLGERAYTTGHLNQVLAEAFTEETGATESIKKPHIVISILCTMHTAYLGISTAEENLSSWPGGMRRYAQTSEQISRAEFKLLEALEVFELTLPTHGRILDLGAAPGGWTRILLDTGLSVIAVDPAQLDPRLTKHVHLHYYNGYAEEFLEEAISRHINFTLIVNDMRMDARDAARLLVTAAACLQNDGYIISTLKLPHETQTMHPLTTLKAALNILESGYSFVRARQLFHNRQEVTVLAAQPRTSRTR